MLCRLSQLPIERARVSWTGELCRFGLLDGGLCRQSRHTESRSGHRPRSAALSIFSSLTPAPCHYRCMGCHISLSLPNHVGDSRLPFPPPPPQPMGNIPSSPVSSARVWRCTILGLRRLPVRSPRLAGSQVGASVKEEDATRSGHDRDWGGRKRWVGHCRTAAAEEGKCPGWHRASSDGRQPAYPLPKPGWLATPSASNADSLHGNEEKRGRAVAYL